MTKSIATLLFAGIAASALLLAACSPRMNVLVVYASRHWARQGIAKCIAGYAQP